MAKTPLNLEYEEKLKRYLKGVNSDAEHLSFKQSCHSVAEAADAVGCQPDDLVKNICMIDTNGQLIVAIVKGEDRSSTSRVAKALNIERPCLAAPEEILSFTGYPCGGTPSFGYTAIFLVDPRVMEKAVVYSGGGSDTSLIRVNTENLLALNQARVVRIRR